MGWKRSWCCREQRSFAPPIYIYPARAPASRPLASGLLCVHRPHLSPWPPPRRSPSAFSWRQRCSTPRRRFGSESRLDFV
eukprot:scaffold111075_cov35-Tisochrysis_lutea.AAC.1